MRVLRISHSAVVDSWRDRERALRDLGVEVDLISARRWDEGGSEVTLAPRPGEPVTGARTWGRHPALFVYDPRPLWTALGRPWDVIDIHEEPFSLAAAEILAIRRLRGQNAPYTLYSAQNLDKRYPIPFRWLERWALTRAAGISVCNEEAGRIVRRKGLPGVASTIPLGIDRRLFRPDRSRPAPSTPIEVGYVGRLAAHKGVQVLLDAVATDDRLRLRCAGSGPQERELRAHTRDLGIADRVEFVGPLESVELAAFYRDLDVLAVPSLDTRSWVEQFGRVAVEAMACGVPVVASASGALPDVVGGAGQLVPPGDAKALASTIVALADDPTAWAAARDAGLARAAECLWERVAEQYREMYDSAVHQPLAAPRRQVEVVVVAYGAPELLTAALAPLRDLPVTVVDNSSSPAVRAVCESFGARYVDPGYNGGFAAGVNRGLAHLRNPDADVLLLNPDAVITPDAVAELHRALLADPDLASVGPVQVGTDGGQNRVDWPYPSPWRTWLEALRLGRLLHGPTFVIGSVLLLRAEALRQVGAFDERFFLYSEETDWAYRATTLGWRHAVVSTASAFHAGGATSTVASRREIHFHASQERFLRKHWGPWGWHAARAGELVGSGVRALLLTGGRAEEARRRRDLYLRGPVEVERASYPREHAPQVGAA